MINSIKRQIDILTDSTTEETILEIMINIVVETIHLLLIIKTTTTTTTAMITDNPIIILRDSMINLDQMTIM